MEPDGISVTVNTGVIRTVNIKKMYGPLWAQDVRVRMDFDDTAYVFERKVTHPLEDSGKPDEWIEVVRTPFMSDEDDKALATINPE